MIKPNYSRTCAFDCLYWGGVGDYAKFEYYIDFTKDGALEIMEWVVEVDEVQSEGKRGVFVLSGLRIGSADVSNFMALQQNLWVCSGSGKSPSV